MSALPRPVSRQVAQRIAQRLDAISHEARVMLVDTLDRRGELSVSELAETVGVSVYDASQHLSVLRGAGVVSRHRHGQHVGYRLDDPTVLAIYEQVAGRIRSQIEHARNEFKPAASATASKAPPSSPSTNGE